MDELSDSLRQFKLDFEAKLKQFFDNTTLDAVVSRGVFKDIERYVTAGGKRLRPYILHRTNAEFGAAKEDITDILIAFEFLHNYTLIDDDIIDQHDIRRDEPTLAKVYEKSSRGRMASKFLSNLLHDTGLELILNAKVDKKFADECRIAYTKISMAVNLAQIEDLKQRNNLSTSEEAYITKVEMVAARFIKYMFRLGACENKELFGKIGLYIGIAFQLADDIMDINEEKKKGRDLGSDIQIGTPTLLSIYTFNHLSCPDKEKFAGLFGKRDMDETELKWIIDKYREAGAIQYVESKIKIYLEVVHKLLEHLKIPETHWIRQLADYSYLRKN